MRNQFLFLALGLTLSFAACSSSPSGPDIDETENAAPSTDECLAKPALAETWGECNVKKALFNRAEQIQSCHQKSKMRAGGTLMLKITVRPNGRVRSVRPEEGGPRNKALEKCLGKALSDLRFARPPEGVKPVIYFPVDFSAGG